MRILAIETSCDETAIAILDATGDEKRASFKVLGNVLLSQVEIHKPYGGVFPALAKREHAKNLVPVLEAALEEAELLREDTQTIPHETRDTIARILEREPGLTEAFLEFICQTERPAIDVIAVTAGPGLEPALWVGVNFAKALALAWELPIVAVNHLEGHILAALASGEAVLTIEAPELPMVALGIAGGHTDLILMQQWLSYQVLGATLDDSVGEAFDKVARMLGLPYPGGPQVSKLAEMARAENIENPFSLPRPMLRSGTYQFSFSGLKTAVLYLLKNKPDLTETERRQVAQEFEDATAEVLWKKTTQALDERGAKTLVVSGGVAANTHIRRVFREECAKRYPELALRFPPANLNTDNALMIAMAGYYRALASPPAGGFADPESLAANGNLHLAS